MGPLLVLCAGLAVVPLPTSRQIRWTSASCRHRFSSQITLDEGERLREALNAMPERDRYAALLLRLLAPSSRLQQADSDAQALDLVEEMSRKGMRLSTEVLCAALNAASSGSTQRVLTWLTAARANGACCAFGTAELSGRPDTRALDMLPKLPPDERAAEGAAVAAVGLLAAGALFTHPPSALLLPALTSGVAFDRYQQQGSMLELVSRGVGRLFGRDLASECAVDAATLVVGYVLGAGTTGIERCMPAAVPRGRACLPLHAFPLPLAHAASSPTPRLASPI